MGRKKHFPVIKNLDEIYKRKCTKCISTYDFSTLYTKIEHSSLIDVLNSLVDFVFKGGVRESIRIEGRNAFWSSRKDNVFNKRNIKLAIKHLIRECYFTVGDKVFIQTIGIPMGIDPAPFWANLYLYKFENSFMESL